jgi:hypothetical protein
MTSRISDHIKVAKVSEVYLLKTTFSPKELEAISSGPSIQTRKNFIEKKPKKKRKKA